MKLYADLQINPYNKTAYRKLAEYYELKGLKNESEAFKELIKRKFNADHSNINEEQTKNNSINP